MKLELVSSIVVGIIIVFLFGRCGAGVSDYSIDLMNGYKLTYEGNNRIYVIGHETYFMVDSIHKDEDFVILHQSSTKGAYKLWVEQVLSSKLFRYTIKNKTFENENEKKEANAIAEYNNFSQSDSIVVQQIIDKGYNGIRNSEVDWNILDNIADSLLDNDINYKDVFKRHVFYWIIDKDNALIKGPYDYQECNIEITKKKNVMSRLSPLLKP